MTGQVYRASASVLDARVFEVGQILVNSSDNKDWRLGDSSTLGGLRLPEAFTLDTLVDVDAPAPSAGDVLAWNNVSGMWEASAPVGDDLGNHTATQPLDMNGFDISFRGPSTGFILESPGGLRLRVLLDDTGHLYTEPE